MQLKALMALGVFVLVLAEAACAQSLTPMRREGTTPSATKGFRLTVGNPYDQRMVFLVYPTTPEFDGPAENARVQPQELILAPGISRQVIAIFDIPLEDKERTIGVCVVPKNISGPVIPRVCGTYTGRSLSR